MHHPPTLPLFKGTVHSSALLLPLFTRSPVQMVSGAAITTSYVMH